MLNWSEKREGGAILLVWLFPSGSNSAIGLCSMFDARVKITLEVINLSLESDTTLPSLCVTNVAWFLI